MYKIEREVCIFDDDPGYVTKFEQLIRKVTPNLKPLGFTDAATLRDLINNPIPKFWWEVKVLIFDLRQKHEDDKSIPNFEVINDIKMILNYHLRIPIFIHSAFADQVTDFRDNNMIFLVTKSPSSVKNICETIALFEESKFLDLFGGGGILETGIMYDLHKAFSEGYKDDVVKTISKLKEQHGNEHHTHVVDHFKQQATNALLKYLSEKK